MILYKAQSLTKELEGFWEQISQEIYNQQFSNISSKTLVEIYNQYEDWWEKDFLNSLLKRYDIEPICNLKNEIAFFMQEYVNDILYETDEEYMLHTAKFRRSFTRMQHIHNRVERMDIVKKALEDDTNYSIIFKNMIEKRNELIKQELNYKTISDFWIKHYQIDMNWVKKACQDILKITSKSFSKLQREVISSSTGSIDGLEIYDLLYASKYSPFDHLINNESYSKILSVLKEYQLDITKGSIQIIRSTTATSPSCLPISVPKNIKVILHQSNSAEFFQSFLHELGHAIFYSNLNEKENIQIKQLGFKGITESFAFYFQFLLMDENFLKKVQLTEEKNIEYVKNFYKWEFLRQLRLLCAKFLLSVYIFENEIEEEKLKVVFKDLFEDALKIKIQEDLSWFYYQDIKTLYEYLTGFIWGLNLSCNIGIKEIKNVKASLFQLANDSDIPIYFINNHLIDLSGLDYLNNLKEKFN